ncbi:MAG: AmmeMemoRadiSam system protein B [Rhodospirillaceae bacterium]|nr:AmmeMemoRadiSam system protein B [Rhodospirillaceae bacterium]
MRVRPAAVAGMFYPEDPDGLRQEVAEYLSGAKTDIAEVPKALIVPHAGYRFSAPVAAEAYALLVAGRGKIRRVVLIGPTHRVAVAGFALSNAEVFETPLGPVAVDVDAVARLAERSDAVRMDLAHAQEHCLEVQLPFLKEALGDIEIVPVLAGQVAPEAVADLLNDLWGGPETLFVVSSDLSHYLSYDDCVTLDAVTAQAIESLTPEKIDRPQACGRLPIAGLLLCAKTRGLTVKTLDVRNSGDTAGPRGQVVGYGAWAFFDGPLERPVTETHGAALLALAEASIRHGLEHGAPLDIDYDNTPLEMIDPGATFVTLHSRGRLRGCIGSVRAVRTIAEDVAVNAYGAAFGDSRFPPLEADELNGLEISVSVLGPMEPISFTDERDLVAKLDIGVDGLVIADHGRRALFLPQVWGQVPDPAMFLVQLKRKAGLSLDESPTLQAWRFRVDVVGRDAL